MTTEERLEELERRLKRETRRNWWRLVAVVLVFVAALVSVPLGIGPLAGMYSTAFVEKDGNNDLVAGQTVVAHKLLLIDGRGDTRAELGLVSGSPTMRFYGTRGGMTLGAYPDGPLLNLFNERTADPSATLRASDDGPILNLAGANGTVVLEAGGPGDSGPALKVFTVEGETRGRVELGVATFPYVALFGETSVVHMQAAGDRPSLDLLDGTGTRIWTAP